MDRNRPDRSTVFVWAAALAGWLAHLAAFWPGMLSWDAAYLWWQARDGMVTTVYSPTLVYVWRGLLWLDNSPAPVFLLQTAMFWIALAMIAARLPWPTFARMLFIAGIGLAPPLWVLFSQVGTDAALVAALTLATACLLYARDGMRSWWCAGAAIALCYAGAMRLNAWPAVLPFLWLLVSGLSAATSWWRRGGLTIALATLMVLAVSGINGLAERQVAVWPDTAMWDLAALSIARNRVLLPPATVGPGMTVDDLEQAFRPWASTTLFAQTRAGVRQPFFQPQQGNLKRAVAGAWWRAVRNDPVAYAKHRWRTMHALLGTRPENWPRELAYIPGQTQFRDNPPLMPRNDAWHRFWMQRFENWRSTAWLAAWPWLLLYVPAVLLAWRHRHGVHGSMSIALVASGIMYTLPLVVAAPGADLRYVGWSMAAALLALGMGAAASWRLPQRSQ